MRRDPGSIGSRSLGVKLSGHYRINAVCHYERGYCSVPAKSNNLNFLVIGLSRHPSNLFNNTIIAIKRAFELKFRLNNLIRR